MADKQILCIGHYIQIKGNQVELTWNWVFWSAMDLPSPLCSQILRLFSYMQCWIIPVLDFIPSIPSWSLIFAYHESHFSCKDQLSQSLTDCFRLNPVFGFMLSTQPKLMGNVQLHLQVTSSSLDPLCSSHPHPHSSFNHLEDCCDCFRAKHTLCFSDFLATSFHLKAEFSCTWATDQFQQHGCL